MQIRRKQHAKGMRAMAAILAGAMLSAALPLTAMSLTTYAAETKAGTTTASATEAAAPTLNMIDLIAPALQKSTNPAGVAQLLATALRYNSITEGDIWQLIQEGCTIPASALQILSQNGTISGYLYKMAAGLPLEPSDLKYVYDKDYYISHNPAISTAIADGTLPSDDQTVFQNFLQVGMPAGLSGSADFDLTYYKANYPDLVSAIGDDNTTYYIHYILIGRQQGLVASHSNH